MTPITVPMNVTATNESVPVQVEENAENLPVSIDLRIGYKGEKGDTGVGIASCVLNSDYTLTITLTDGTFYTTESIRGAQGERGADGAAGKDGKDGVDGVSPSASVSKVGNTATLTVTDGSGTTTAEIYDGTSGSDGKDGKDGRDGTNGSDGISPVVSITEGTKQHTLSIIDASGTHSTVIYDGQDGHDGQNGSNGQDGEDGFSPTASVTKSGGVATITITDKNGTTTETVSDGQNGTNGQDGAAGQDGKSAYQYAVDGGYTGTEQEFTAKMAAEIPTKTSDLTNDSEFITGMEILSYGHSTWADFLAAYTAKKVVYCRASSGSNPGSGSQTRLAFMAYVNNADATSITEVEFQYYRSVSSHSATQQGDQVYVYKLNKTNGWSVTVREAMSKIAVGTGLKMTYSSGTITISLDS